MMVTELDILKKQLTEFNAIQTAKVGQMDVLLSNVS
jgi:hypothetical protein